MSAAPCSKSWEFLCHGPTRPDHGRREITHNPADDMVFKVPRPLRNVARTAPYFHDGSAPTLDTAVRMMAHHQLGVELSEEEAQSIAAWLGSLTGDIPREYIEAACSAPSRPAMRLRVLRPAELAAALPQLMLVFRAVCPIVPTTGVHPTVTPTLDAGPFAAHDTPWICATKSAQCMHASWAGRELESVVAFDDRPGRRVNSSIR